MNVKRARSVPERLTRAQSQARTRAQLLSAGAEVFARRGYHEASIEEIVAAAGYSRGAFYANFADKADLFLAILDQQRQREFGELAEVLNTADDQGRILPALGDGFPKPLSGPLDRATAESRPAAAETSQHRERLAENLRAVRTLTAEMIARYCRRHDIELTVDHETFAAMVTALVTGFADQLRLDPEDVSLDTVGLA